jgi:glycyl-tRNA synthetase
MAEIEHFVDPLCKDHDRFSEVAHIKLRLLCKDVQSAGKTDISEITVGEAVASVSSCASSSSATWLTTIRMQGMIDNQTLGYFIARIHLFLTKIGIIPSRLRFRQHMSNEMAHYAADCWDAEIETSFGWIECVGCADRSAYDLTVHAAKTGTRLSVQVKLPEPLKEIKNVVGLDKKIFGPLFKKDAKLVEDAIMGLSDSQLGELAVELADKQSVLAIAPS